jgi:nucleotide-binding universal stress UspA family protein
MRNGLAAGSWSAAAPKEIPMTAQVLDAPVRNRFAPAQAAWRTLITHVQPEADAQPRLAVAADLTHKLGATLIGVGAEMLPPAAASDPTGMLGGEFVSAMLEVIQTNLAASKTAFAAAAAHVDRIWISVEDMPDRAVERLCRGADLIVAGGMPAGRHDGYRACGTADLILNAGRPVLVAPPGGGTLAAQAVVVAWSDSRESRRALADSLPVLRCADEVLLVEICAKEDADDVVPHHRAVLDYLARHGIKARSKVLTGNPRIATDALEAEAQALGADLIVAGGYGHSRLGEWVMGGVTADLLANPQRFVLFSH